MKFDIIAIIELLIIVQGILFGTILLYNNKKRKARYLGAFTLTLSLSMIYFFLIDSGLQNIYEDTYYLPLTFNLFIYTFLYLYVSDITKEAKKIPWWVFCPAILDLVVQIIVFLMSISILRDEIMYIQTHIRNVFNIAWSIFLAVKMILMLRRKQKEVVVLSNNNNKLKAIKWVLHLVYAMLSFEFLATIYLVLGSELQLRLKTFMAFYGLVLVYWVTLKVFFYEKTITIFPSLEIKDRVQKKERVPEKVKETKVVSVSNDEEDIDELKQIVEDARQYINSEKLFKAPDLTILDISKGIEVHYRKLSRAINIIEGENFNTFINKFRVEEAKEMLTNTQYKNWSVEGIGQDVGFKSKSSFYGAFKKLEHTTPLRFKQNALNNNDDNQNTYARS